MTARDVVGDLVAVAHAGFVVFVIGGFWLILAGELFKWRWVRNPWFRYLHLAATLFTLVRIWLGMTCPMWILEDWVRGGVLPAYDRLTEWCHRMSFRGASHRVFQIKITFFSSLVIAEMFLSGALKRRETARALEQSDTPSGDLAPGA